ncbi:galactonate dehydratase [Roseisalinus antarcticus]|uniref:D-galactonate dehydratase n=1 Tax=Roseisalinus antarcticus TaxID=254357 RepID=A0A1Y5RXL5_9RHOB|nr:galactonate dehydratase [Roseisalinus antarcticus]SLN26777.1 D-galactonate dehydratase [Roseisalinus antarcticus]
MKITAIKTTLVNAQMRNWLFVRVETDQPGLYGWGEGTLEWKTRAVAGAVEDLSPLMVGRDPRDIENAVRVMHKHGFWRMGVIGTSAISAIELALWDILGKELGVPVWRLLGGKVRDRVAVYTHLGLGDMRSVYETTQPDELAELGARVVAQGYKALKVVMVPYTHMHAPRRAVDHVGRLMEALRGAVGDDVEIMLDFHGRPGTTAAALDYIHAVAPGRPMFVEEPVQPGDAEMMREVTERSPVPIAAGERLIGRSEFAPHVARRAFHIAQPDICHTGGMAEARKIATMCETAGIAIAPHNPLGPIASAAALHFDVVTPNFLIQEEMTGAVPWYDDVVDGPVERVDGAWMVPTAPGLGVEVNEAACAAHPYAPEVQHAANAVLDDGTVVDW